jgi:hypothetical protein
VQHGAQIGDMWSCTYALFRPVRRYAQQGLQGERSTCVVGLRGCA